MDRSVLVSKLRARGFKAVEPLKCAGHASIFRVSEDSESESYVAKVVSLTGLDAKGRASAQQEVSLLKGLSAHPNLIAYRDSFMEEAGILYIIMTLAEDGDLRRVVTEAQVASRTLPEPLVLTWIRQTLLGLRLLHKQGVVHRDLKSSNIFLCERRRRIRIGDFGISRVLESTAFATSCVGTPAYMSPELMRNERYDYHVDMWALGCIVYELCTLRMPFAANSLLELACQVMEGEPNWAPMDNRSEEITEVAVRLLQKDVARRPTAAQLLNEILFASGIEPTEEDWASLQSTGALSMRSPDKKVQATMSTAVTGSSGGEWTLTPRMPWETSSRASESTDASPGTGARSLGSSLTETEGKRLTGSQKLVNHELTREEFADMLTAFQGSLLTELRSGSRGAMPDSPSANLTPSMTTRARMQVAETVV